MKCANCGEKIKKNYNLCPNCGEKIEKLETNENPIKYYRIIISLLIVALIVVGVCLVVPNVLKPDIEELKKSVVQIYVYDERDEMIATGSGVVAFEDDVIITNAHVVEKNYKLEVISENNTKYQVEGIIGYNKEKDIAILKLSDSKNLKALDIKDTLSVGDDVIAIGSPLGLKNTVSNGILSGYFQDAIKVYQHTAPISPGSSGGALFDERGRLVGITYASIDEGQNINFAIPIKEVEKEYNIVKNNVCLDTEYYKFLNNGILKTQKGSQFIEYVLNDEYGNEKFKSGVQDDTIRGNLEFSALSNDYWFFGEGYKDIKKYVKSSVYISSGNHVAFHIDEFGNMTRQEPDYYNVVIIKLRDSSEVAIKEIEKYFEEHFMSELYEKAKTVIQHGQGYIYLIQYENYDNIEQVKSIMKDFVK